MDRWYDNPMHDPFSLERAGNTSGALLVHGFTGSPADVRALGEAVHEVGIDAHALMLPGMAREITRLNDMTGAIWRDAVETEWERITSRYERTVLLGYSLGGALATLAAVSRPPDLLVLIAPLTRLPVRATELLPLGKYLIRGVNVYGKIDWSDERIHDWYRKVRPDIDTRDPETQRLFREEAAFSTRMLDEMRALLVDVRRAAGKITVPALVVQGTEDGVVFPRFTRQFAMKLGGQIVYREMPGDHYLPLKWLGAWPYLRVVVQDELRRWLESRPGNTPAPSAP
jgi:carboxylesterase